MLRRLILFLVFGSGLAYGQLLPCTNTSPTTTPNLGFQLPVTNACNWGPPVNTNFTALDLLLSGHANLTALSFASGTITGPFTVQTKNQGTNLTLHSTALAINCSTNMTCADDGTTLTLTSTGGGGSTPTGTGFIHVTSAVQDGAARAVDVSGADITGNMGVSHLNSGTSASSTTFWRGDATWATPAGAGTVTQVTSGNFSPLFTVGVATNTSTPAFTFTASTAAANTVFGNFTGSPAAPTFTAAPTFSAANLTSFPTFNQNTTGTAAALTSTPTNCGAGIAAIGILANGNATGCFTPPAGTVTSVATTSPITGGPFSTTGTIACATCVTSTSPGLGLAHFPGSSQNVTSSLAVQADVTNGYVDLSSTQATIAGAKTFTGLTTLTNVNSRVMCDQSTGATFDAKVTACIATVIAQGGGIADATGLIGTQTHSAEVDVGNGSSIPVTLLLSPFLTDLVTMTTSGACAFKVFDGSRLIGTTVGITHQAIIKNGSVTTNTGSLICTNDGAGAGQYITIQGLMAYNQGGTAGTFTKGLVFIKNIFDTSSVRDMVITNEASGDGLVVEAACCASLFFNIQSDGSHTAGSRPCVFKSITGDIQPMNGVAFQNMSCVHPGTGLSAVTIQHTYTSTATPCSIAFTGLLYIEGNSTDTTTPLLTNDSCTALYIQALTAQFRSVTSTAVPISVTHTSVPGLNPVTNLTQGVIQNSPQTFPATFISDTASSVTVKTDSQGVASYLGYPLTFIAQTPAGVGDARFTPNTSVGLHIRVNLNNLNPLRLEDSTLTPRAIDLGPNVTSNGTFGIRDATGPKNLLSLSWVSPFTATFPGPISTGATCTAGTGGMYCGTEGTAATVLAATDMFYADSTAHLFKASYNGGPFGAMINTDAQASIVADSAAINTTDTVIVKSAALAANRLLAGSVIRVVLDGTCTSTVANVSTFTIRWGTNGTTADGTIAAVATSVAATSGTTNPFHTELLLTVRTAGASATSDATGELASQGNIGIVATPNAFFVAGTAFNTTTASGILSVSYKTAATTTTSTFRNAFIEVVHQ